MSKHILFLIASLLFLSSCTWWEGDMQRVVTSSSGYVEELATASPKIKETKEFESCIKPSINMCLSQVANQLAREQKSITFCDELSDVSSQEACKYGVINIQAMEARDIQICNSLSENYKRECRISILQAKASDVENIGKCDAIKWEYILTGSGVQDTRWSDRVDQCKLNILIKNNSLKEKECEVLKGISTKEMCQSLAKIQTKIEPPLSPKK